MEIIFLAFIIIGSIILSIFYSKSDHVDPEAKYRDLNLVSEDNEYSLNYKHK